MARVNIERPISFNTSKNRFERSVLVKNKDGNLVRDTEILETKSSQGVSQGSNTVENLTTSIEPEKLSYTLSSNYIENSLSVYYNGVNITNDISSKTSNGFTLISEYRNIIDNSDNEILLAVYSTKE